jgi:hypothetical protein
MNQRTIFCGKLHRTKDGVPVAHACRVVEPDYLHAERAQEYGRAATLLERMRVVLHDGVYPHLDRGERVAGVAPDGGLFA